MRFEDPPISTWSLLGLQVMMANLGYQFYYIWTHLKSKTSQVLKLIALILVLWGQRQEDHLVYTVSFSTARAT